MDQKRLFFVAQALICVILTIECLPTTLGESATDEKASPPSSVVTVAGAPTANNNKPVVLVQTQDYAPDSPEARVADATTQFGLTFIKSLPTTGTSRENTVVSPVSLQILLNIILLGSDDQSTTQAELAKVLGYDEANNLFPMAANNNKSDTTTSNSTAGQLDRSRPHAAMSSLLESISNATHQTSDEQQQQQQQQLLNSSPQLAAHLQTTVRDGGSGAPAPTSGQLVNFTLANLMLTNQDLIKTNPNYENDLKRYYDIKVEHFSNTKSSGGMVANVTTTTANTTAAASAEQVNQTLTAAAQVDTRPLHERVNSWVQNITQNQISELVKEADLSGDDLIMVLLNAAHFKGRWLHTFNSKQTHERLFYNDGQPQGQEVKFMRQSGVFGYAEFGSLQMLASAGGEQQVLVTGGTSGAGGQQTSTSDETVLTEDLASTTGTGNSSNGRANDKTGAGDTVAAASPPVIELSKEEAKRYELTSNLNCSVLMLPFALNDGQELSMVILLPTKRDGLQELMANLNGPALNEIYKSLNEQHVQVELPKFSFESSLDAKSTLLSMGLTKVFQNGAELGRMLVDDSPKNVAKVDKIVHKAKIAVDEDGAEAAAASAATIVLRNLIRPPNPTFVADHPFLFVIRHNKSNLPLFMGTIQKL
uniref:Serpin I2 n=1 Tax=Aceria tosichella TaxID=561515 RepID=A0A6G1S7U0_9ACAR